MSVIKELFDRMFWVNKNGNYQGHGFIIFYKWKTWHWVRLKQVGKKWVFDKNPEFSGEFEEEEYSSPLECFNAMYMSGIIKISDSAFDESYFSKVEEEELERKLDEADL